MKKKVELIGAFSIIMFFLSVIFGAKSNDRAIVTGTYCDGFSEGYVSGYCFGNPACVKPVIPVCPVPIPGQNEYRDGFDRGFIYGHLKDQETK